VHAVIKNLLASFYQSPSHYIAFAPQAQLNTGQPAIGVKF
jgi:hypothetical protein